MGERCSAVNARQSDDFTAELDAMSRDPEIQRELAVIESEFLVTDGDGLDVTSDHPEQGTWIESVLRKRP